MTSGGLHAAASACLLHWLAAGPPRLPSPSTVSASAPRRFTPACTHHPCARAAPALRSCARPPLVRRRLVAVSHGYAWECQTQEGGWGLHGIFQEHAWKLRGASCRGRLLAQGPCGGCCCCCWQRSAAAGRLLLPPPVPHCRHLFRATLRNLVWPAPQALSTASTTPSGTPLSTRTCSRVRWAGRAGPAGERCRGGSPSLWARLPGRRLRCRPLPCAPDGPSSSC